MKEKPNSIFTDKAENILCIIHLLLNKKADLPVDI